MWVRLLCKDRWIIFIYLLLISRPPSFLLRFLLFTLPRHPDSPRSFCASVCHAHTHTHTHSMLSLTWFLMPFIWLAERKTSLESSKYHREEDRGVCCSLPLTPYLISTAHPPPSTLISPLSLPASPRPCRMTRHECSRQTGQGGVMYGWVTHTHLLPGTNGGKNVMMMTGWQDGERKVEWRSCDIRRPIHLLTSGLGAATEPGQVKVTNSWHLLWTTKLQTAVNTVRNKMNQSNRESGLRRLNAEH